MSELDDALKVREDFLEAHPKYKEYQKEIDSILDGIVDAEGRMQALFIMMQCKLAEQLDQFKSMQEKASEIQSIIKKISEDIDNTSIDEHKE